MKRPGRLVLRLLAGLVLASAWVSLPLPVSWLPATILLEDGVALGLQVQAASLRWADGRVRLRGVRATLGAGTELELAEAVLRFAPPRLVRGELPLSMVAARGLRGHTGPADRELLERLLRSDGETPPMPRLDLHLEDGELTWQDPATGLQLPLRIRRLQGRLAPGNSRLYGTLRGPLGHEIQVWAREQGGSGLWQLDLACLAVPLTPPPGASALMPADSTAQAGRCAIRARVALSPTGLESLVLDLDLAGGTFHLARPSLGVEDLQLRVHGTWQDGLAARLQARVEGVPLTLQGWFSGGTSSPPLLLAEGSLGPVVVDGALAARIRQLDPGAGEALEALEPRGAVPIALGLQWQPGAPPLWAAHAPLAGMDMAYRGFREASGARPSFPYPVHDLAGDALFSGRTLLFQVSGAMGTGRLAGSAVVEIGDGPASLAVDLQVEDLPVDAEITRAAAGTPELRRAWAELGHPDGGLVDASLAVRRSAGGGKKDVDVELQATARGVALRPAFLPVPVQAEHLLFRWRPGRATFAGTVAALGGRAEIEGRIQAARSEGLETPVPALVVRGRGSGFAPDAGERRVLEAFLDLPAGAADFAIGGPLSLDLSLRRAAREDSPQLLVAFDGGGARAVWTVTGMGCTDLRGRGAVARAGLATLVTLPRGRAEVDGGRAELSLAGVLQERHGVLPIVARGGGIEFTPVLRATAETVLDISSSSHLRLGGRIGGYLHLDPARPEELRGRVLLEDLECAARFQDQSVALRLTGRMDLRGRQVHAPLLEMRQGERRSEIRDLLIEPRAGGGVDLRATLVAQEGLEVAPALAAILEPEAAAALAAVGLEARVRADGLDVRLEVPAEAEAGLRLEARGGMVVDGLRLAGPPRLRAGSARLEVEELHWYGPEDFGARLRFEGGGGILEDLQLAGARGEAVVDPQGIRVRPFSAHLLGGLVTSDPPAEAEGEAGEEGLLHLRFAPGPPLRFRLYVQDLSLERMREELDLAAGLAGLVSGHLDMASSSPSPLDYGGQGELHIANGALGAVPVLKDVWRAAGVRPPQFHSGHIRFSTNTQAARGTVRIHEFRLQHELLEAFGKGWIDMDGYLRLKVTVRTFSVFGRLPLVKDLLDVLLEQDVFGPMEQPVITHRAYGKLTGTERARHPFPLWAPAPPWPDWRPSPILPQGADLGAGL